MMIYFYSLLMMLTGIASSQASQNHKHTHKDVPKASSAADEKSPQEDENTAQTFSDLLTHVSSLSSEVSPSGSGGVQERRNPVSPQDLSLRFDGPTSSLSQERSLSAEGMKRTLGKIFPCTLEQNMGKTLPLSPLISEIFVANPEIADVQLNSGMAAYLLGKKPGTTLIIATDAQGKVVLTGEVRVIHNLKQLEQTTQKIFPKEKVKFDSTPAGIIIKGSPSSPAAAQSIQNLASTFVDRNQGQRILNTMKVPATNQVLLKVKVAEVSRTVLNQFGINWSALFSGNTISGALLMGGEPIVDGKFTGSSTIPNAYGISFNKGARNYAALLDALDSENLATILAEPNLVALSGETASFLVGGEYPYPVPQDGTVAVQFKEFGISLSFTPTVLDAQHINIRVRPEVSTLDYQDGASVPLPFGGVISVPGVKTRKAETSIELGSGQSLAIAGLVSSSLSNAYDGLPGISDIPVLGALFRSSKFRRGETELIIIVTPYVVTPPSEKIPLPTEGVQLNTAFQTLLTGSLLSPSAKSPKKLLSFHGNGGFIQ